MEFRKRLWLLYLLVNGLKIVLTMFAAYVQHQSGKNASNWSRTAASFRSLIRTSGCGVNWPLRTLAYKWKKLREFCIEFFCYLFGVCNNQKKQKPKKSQPAMASMSCLFWKKQSFGPSRANRIKISKICQKKLKTVNKLLFILWSNLLSALVLHPLNCIQR